MMMKRVNKPHLMMMSRLMCRSTLQVLLVVLLLSATTFTHAFPSGAGNCVGGRAAVGASHETATQVIQGTLEDAGIVVAMGSRTLDATKITPLPINTNFRWHLNSTFVDSNNMFRGFLMRLEDRSDDATVDTSAALYSNDNRVQVAETVCLNTFGVGGVTHVDNRPKRLVRGRFVMKEAAAELQLDVTVVMKNRNRVSQYYYSAYIISILEDGDQFDHEKEPFEDEKVEDETDTTEEVNEDDNKEKEEENNDKGDNNNNNNNNNEKEEPGAENTNIEDDTGGNGNNTTSTTNNNQDDADNSDVTTENDVNSNNNNKDDADDSDNTNGNNNDGKNNNDEDSDRTDDNEDDNINNDNSNGREEGDASLIDAETDSDVDDDLTTDDDNLDDDDNDDQVTIDLDAFETSVAGPPLFVRASGCTVDSPCGRCEGDCNKNSHCQEGLECFFRPDETAVPGCMGTGVAGTDYCYEPQADTLRLRSKQCSDEAPCDSCQGECLSDTDCMEGLACFRRPDLTPVPGCNGDGISGRNYCYVQPDDPTLLTLRDTDCNRTAPCDACEGECTRDRHCKGDLQCFLRPDLTPVPGCSEGGVAGRNYCFKPVPGVLVQRTTECSSFLPCMDACQGECNSDDDCYGSLQCFQRSGDETVPGCDGSGITGRNYCFDPSSNQDEQSEEMTNSESNLLTTLSPTVEVPKKEIDVSSEVEVVKGRTSAPTEGVTEEPTKEPKASRPTRTPRPSFPPTSRKPTPNPTPPRPPTRKPTPNPTQTPRPSPRPTPYPTKAENLGETSEELQVQPLDDVFGENDEPDEGNKVLRDRTDPCSRENPCGECQGDCNTDEQCQGSLQCFQRPDDTMVPGCVGRGTSGTDYCAVNPATLPININAMSPQAAPQAPPTRGRPTLAPTPPRPTLAPSLRPTEKPYVDDFDEDMASQGLLLHERDDGDCTEEEPCDECQGDCDGDDECAGNLRCYFRASLERVPGCTGKGLVGKDYCAVDPNFKPDEDDNDERPEKDNDEKPDKNPGDDNGGPDNADNNDGFMFAEKALGVLEIRNLPCTKQQPCSECQGDCASDEDCEGILQCFFRLGTEEVPGCYGEGIRGQDYCALNPALKQAGGVRRRQANNKKQGKESKVVKKGDGKRRRKLSNKGFLSF